MSLNCIACKQDWKEHSVDARAKHEVSFFVACSGNPATTVKIPAAMRAKGYSDTSAVDRVLKMQVCREVEKLKGGVSAAALAALCAAAVMVALSLTVMTKARALILPEDANSTLPLDLPSPPRKTHAEQATSTKLAARMSRRASRSTLRLWHEL